MPDFYIVQQALPTAGPTTIDFTATGFPASGARAALVFISGATVSGTQVDHALFAHGFTDGTRFFCSIHRSVDGGAASSTVNNNRDDRVCFMTNSDGSVVTRLLFNSWLTSGTNGIRFDVTITGVPAAYLCTVILIGGGGISNVYAGSVTGSAVIGNSVTVSTLSAAPTFMLTLNPNAGRATFDELDVSSGYISMGMVQNTGSDPPPQYSSNWLDTTTANPTQLFHWLDTGAVSSDVGSGREAEIREFSATGFKVYTRTSAAAPTIAYLAVTMAAGLSAKVMQVDSPIVTGTATITGIGMTPQFGLLLMSAQDALDSQALGTDGEVYGVGVMTAAAQASLAVRSDDNVTPANCESMTSGTKAVFMRRLTEAGTFMDATFTSFTSDTATFSYTTANGTPRKWAALFVSEAPISTMAGVTSFALSGGAMIGRRYV